MRARRGHRGRVHGLSERRDRNQRSQDESSDKRLHDTSPYLDGSSAICAFAQQPIGLRLRGGRWFRGRRGAVMVITFSDQFRVIQM